MCIKAFFVITLLFYTLPHSPSFSSFSPPPISPSFFLSPFSLSLFLSLSLQLDDFYAELKWEFYTWGKYTPPPTVLVNVNIFVFFSSPSLSFITK